MSPARSPWPRLALLLCLALPLACVNPFKPADPEPPDANAPVEDYRSPEATLETMQLAIQSKTSGANAWLHAFAESTQVGDRAYRCFYDDAVKRSWEVGASRSAPEPWDLSLERGVHSSLAGIRPNATYAFAWEFDPSAQKDDDPALSDTVQYHRKYTLKASDGGTLSTILIGFCDLSFEKVSGRWTIYRWNDRVDPDVGVNPAVTDERSMTWRRLESLSR
jgi:hypothetical protein